MKHKRLVLDAIVIISADGTIINFAGSASLKPDPIILTLQTLMLQVFSSRAVSSHSSLVRRYLRGTCQVMG